MTRNRSSYVFLTRLISTVVVLILTFGSGYVLGGGCQISVRNDIHVAPAAELATTKGYPDIITLENSLISVSSIPNRGRLLFDLQVKETGNSVLFTEKSPMPLETDEGFYLEFGGLYSSYPWNPRANQPFDMDYEIVEQSTSTCSIKLLHSDSEKKIDFEGIITLEENSHKVRIDLHYVNNGKETVSFDVSNKMVAVPGDEMVSGTKIVLPAEVEEVVLVESKDGWMGEAGGSVSWPKPWSKWGEYPGKGIYEVVTEGLSNKFAKAVNPNSGEYVEFSWDDTNVVDRLRVSSWGPAYDDVFGAYPGFSISLIKESLDLEAGDERTLTFFVSAGTE